MYDAYLFLAGDVDIELIASEDWPELDDESFSI